jgi:uncharacterized membrane protein YkvA (DUF1232 family)
LGRWKQAAHRLKRDVHALYFAYRDPRTPWPAKLMALAVVAYALSPLDLIPDPVPVLGYLDDLLLLPVGIWLTLRLIPPGVMADARCTAAQAEVTGAGVGWVAAALIVLVWLAVMVWAGSFLWRWLR